MNEEWRAVTDYEGVYEVSSLGQVRGVDRVLPDGRNWKGKTLTLDWGRSGYLEVKLPIPGRSGRFARTVHRLVCTAFHGEPPVNKPLALHRNGYPGDNRASNLYWGDYDDNMKDRIRHGRHFNTKTHCKRGHELTQDNIYTPPKSPNSRYCRACRRIRHENWYDRLREGRNA